MSNDNWWQGQPRHSQTSGQKQINFPQSNSNLDRSTYLQPQQPARSVYNPAQVQRQSVVPSQINQSIRQTQPLQKAYTQHQPVRQSVARRDLNGGYDNHLSQYVQAPVRQTVQAPHRQTVQAPHRQSVQAPQRVEYRQAPQQVEYRQAPQQVEYRQAPQQVEQRQAPQQVEYRQAPQKVEYVQRPQEVIYVERPKPVDYDTYSQKAIEQAIRKLIQQQYNTQQALDKTDIKNDIQNATKNTKIPRQATILANKATQKVTGVDILDRLQNRFNKSNQPDINSMSDSNLRTIFNKYDKDQSKTIDREEFNEFLKNYNKEPIDKDEFDEVCKKVGVDNQKDTLTFEELKRVLGHVTDEPKHNDDKVTNNSKQSIIAPTKPPAKLKSGNQEELEAKHSEEVNKLKQDMAELRKQLDQKIAGQFHHDAVTQASSDKGRVEQVPQAPRVEYTVPQPDRVIEYAPQASRVEIVQQSQPAGLQRRAEYVQQPQPAGLQRRAEYVQQPQPAQVPGGNYWN